MDFTLRVVDEGIEHLCKKRCCHFKTGGMTVRLLFCTGHCEHSPGGQLEAGVDHGVSLQRAG